MHQWALCPEALTQPRCQSRIGIKESIHFLGVLCGQFLLAAWPAAALRSFASLEPEALNRRRVKSQAVVKMSIFLWH